MNEVDPRKLVVFVEDDSSQQNVGPVALPSLSDVLYEPAIQPAVSPRARAGNRVIPLGTKTRVTGSVGKRCDNCRLWAESEEKCVLLGREVVVLASQVCGYHVAGTPQMFVTALSGTGSLTPELAGLIDPPSTGATCNSCTYYDAQLDDEGSCRAVATDGLPAQVDALGCCARWRSKPDPELPEAPPLR